MKLCCVVTGVSLITGLEYVMKRYNGKWNGTVNVRAQLQLTRITSDTISGVTGTAQLSSVSLGLLYLTAQASIWQIMPTACKHGTVASSSSGALLF